MITVNVVKENKKYKKISILGHAMYDEYGKDIVCAACSSIITTSVNGILKLDKEAISYKQTEEGIIINIKKDDNVTNTLLNNMVDLLKELEQSYPKNIRRI